MARLGTKSKYIGRSRISGFLKYLGNILTYSIQKGRYIEGTVQDHSFNYIGTYIYYPRLFLSPLKSLM